MILWLILAVMTATAVFAVLRPLSRSAVLADSGGSDVAVYRDQIDEIERDLAAGLIGTTEAEAARVEISRRLLAAADAVQGMPPALSATPAARRRRMFAAASLLTLPILAAGLYLRLGSPELAFAQRAPQSDDATSAQSIESLIAKAEEHLQRNPDDGRGWEVLAPVYMRLDRYADAVNAWRNALHLLGETAERDANLGEALTAEANGIVTAEAKTAFVQAAALDDTLVSPHYYLGLAAEQDGRREEAAKIWRDLIADAPADARWISEVRDALARVENKPRTTTGGPSAAQMAAAADQPPEQQNAMINGMVDRLAARLKQNGSDVAGWLQLIRSYNVLNQPDKAGAATAEAQLALGADPDKLAQFNAALKGTSPDPTPAAAPNTDNFTPRPPPSAPVAHDDPAAMQSMVDRLAERLKDSGSDPKGWLMLVRSYETLGEKDRATAAVASARQALAGDPAKLNQFNEALKSFKISE
jgi:cytochrome c-type biogenesis protein CcmH